MKISQLSETTGVPLATIKMYLRESLLQPGEKSGPNQAVYGEAHVRRLRLVHGLLRVGGLSVAAARDVVAAIDSDMPLVQTFGVAQCAVTAPIDPETLPDSALAVVDRLTADWDIDSHAVGRALAARSVAAFEAAGQTEAAQWYERYAAAALLVAEADLDLLDTRSGKEAQAETVVLGTVLGDTFFAGLRRAAQEHLSRLRYSAPPDATRPTDTHTREGSIA